jgi:hypothetical protein
VLVSIGTAGLAWPLSQLQPLPGANASFAESVLIFSATLFGIVPLLASAAVIAAVQMTSGAVSPAPFAECIVLFGAAWLLRSRVPITLSAVLYTGMQVALLALFAGSVAELQVSQVDARIVAALLNFSLVSLALCCLPRHSRRWPNLFRRAPRRSLARLVFSTATLTTMLLLVAFTHIAKVQPSPALLIAALVAIAILATVAHVASSMASLADDKVVRQQNQRRRPSLTNISAEAADVALGWLHRLHQMRLAARESDRDLMAVRIESASYRS